MVHGIHNSIAVSGLILGDFKYNSKLQLRARVQIQQKLTQPKEEKNPKAAITHVDFVFSNAITELII